MTSPGLARFARAVLPPAARRWLRRAAREAPHRLRDFPKDVVGAFSPRSFGGPIPPPGLRARVGSVGSRSEFMLVGRDGARNILQAFERAAAPGRAYPDWLDFGCGCGRLARWLIEAGASKTYTGVDVDARQVAWADRHLAGRFTIMRPEPPLPFADASFDVVLAVSIFTHLSEDEQFAWLSEIRRLLRTEGLLVVTTLSPDFAPATPGLTGEELARLDERGFLAAGLGSPVFNDRSTFHSRVYLERDWARFLRLRSHEPGGFVRYQDLSVWEKTAEAA